jgi:hypothetical protein
MTALVLRVERLKPFRHERLPITVQLAAECSPEHTWVVAIAFRVADNPRKPLEGDAYLNPRQEGDHALLLRLTRQHRFPLIFLSPDLRQAVGKTVSWSEQQRQEVQQLLALIPAVGLVSSIEGSWDPDFEQAKRAFQARYSVQQLLSGIQEMQ